MPYLIDGNNVMAQNVGWHRDKGKARRRLIHDLADFVAVRRMKVRVVFDGVPDAEFPDGSRFKSVGIFYAKPGSDADSRIADMVKRASYKRDLTVVSSDKRLASRVSSQGARVIPSGVFRRMLTEAQSMKRHITRENPSVDVDEWLAYFDYPADESLEP